MAVDLDTSIEGTVFSRSWEYKDKISIKTGIATSSLRVRGRTVSGPDAEKKECVMFRVGGRDQCALEAEKTSHGCMTQLAHLHRRQSPFVL